jgi:hypothetical protein
MKKNEQSNLSEDEKTYKKDYKLGLIERLALENQALGKILKGVKKHQSDDKENTTHINK